MALAYPQEGARGWRSKKNRGSRAFTPRVGARAHPGHQGTGARVCETEGLSQGLPSRGESRRRASGTETTPRVGTRALPGLQVVRANNCLTEGLSEGEGSRGWRKGDMPLIYHGPEGGGNSEAHAPPAVGVSATAPQPCRPARVRSRTGIPQCSHRKGRCRLGWCSPHPRTWRVSCVCCSYIQYSII